jgi:hypothetical protein
MKIKYRFSFAWDSARALQLENLGLKVDPPSWGQAEVIGVSQAIEGDPGWSEASQLVRNWKGNSLVTTEFTAPEIASAEYCRLRVCHTSGYPQPETDFAYREQTFDTASFCSECGVGLVQDAPFRVLNSLKWGRNTFLKLNWVDDAYFMLRQAWEDHLAPLGVECRNVEDLRGRRLESMVQLRADISVPLIMGDVSGTNCGKCGRERYPGHCRGYFPAPSGRPNLPIFRSEQYFGANHQSSNAIIVNAQVATAIQSAGLRGVELWPCAPPG